MAMKFYGRKSVNEVVETLILHPVQSTEMNRMTLHDQLHCQPDRKLVIPKSKLQQGRCNLRLKGQAGAGRPLFNTF